MNERERGKIEKRGLISVRKCERERERKISPLIKRLEI